MARPDFPLSINRRRLLATGAAAATAAIAPASDHHPIIPLLQLFEQARLTQHLGIQAFGRNKENREFQGMRRIDVFGADVLRTASDLVFEVAPVLRSQFGVTGRNRVLEMAESRMVLLIVAAILIRKFRFPYQF